MENEPLTPEYDRTEARMFLAGVTDSRVSEANATAYALAALAHTMLAATAYPVPPTAPRTQWAGLVGLTLILTALVAIAWLVTR